jgi:hypothetical protein
MSVCVCVCVCPESENMKFFGIDVFTLHVHKNGFILITNMGTLNVFVRMTAPRGNYFTSFPVAGRRPDFALPNKFSKGPRHPLTTYIIVHAFNNTLRVPNRY